MPDTGADERMGWRSFRFDRIQNRRLTFVWFSDFNARHGVQGDPATGSFSRSFWVLCLLVLTRMKHRAFPLHLEFQLGGKGGPPFL
jgi:hypothetical protein